MEHVGEVVISKISVRLSSLFGYPLLQGNAGIRGAWAAAVGIFGQESVKNGVLVRRLFDSSSVQNIQPSTKTTN